MSAVAQEFRPRVRPMTWDDLPTVFKIETASYEFPWTLGILRDCLRVGYLCYVLDGNDPARPKGATPGSDLLGHGVMSLGAGECHLLNVCVHPHYQRRGYGQQLVYFLLEAARSRGARLALLEVRASNLTAYRLYTRMGFDEVGVRSGYYPAANGREDAIILARDLTI